MITIQSTQPASLRIYLDDELFIDQTLPWPTTKLTASTEHKVRTVRIENHGQKEVNASADALNQACIAHRTPHGMQTAKANATALLKFVKLHVIANLEHKIIYHD